MNPFRAAISYLNEHGWAQESFVNPDGQACLVGAINLGSINLEEFMKEFMANTQKLPVLAAYLSEEYLVIPELAVAYYNNLLPDSPLARKTALHLAAHRTIDSEIKHIVQQVIQEQFPERDEDEFPEDFNDHPDTTEDDVILVLEKAAVLWDETV